MKVTNSPLANIIWALHPGYIEVVDHVLTAHFTGQRPDLAAIEAQSGPLNNEARKPYAITDRVAVLRLSGVIGKRMNLFTRISGGISTEQARQDIADALADPKAAAMVLAIDSPGGTVDGTAELADWLRSQRGGKPIYTWVDGSMMSAALWIGTAADRVYGYTTSLVGSISAVMTHYDRSGQDDKAGIKRTFITSGPYKRMANDAEPLSSDGRDYLQSLVDAAHDLFVEGVAANLGVSPEQVASYADGRVFPAAEAVQLGIIAGIKTLDETIAAARAAADKSKRTTGGIMNAQDLKQEYPDAAADLIAEGKEQAGSDLSAAVGAETERMIGLYAMLHGDDAVGRFKALADAGLTAGQAKALTEAGIVGAAGQDSQGEAAGAEQEERQRILAALEETGQDNPGSGASANIGDFQAAIAAEQAANPKMSKVEAMQAAARKYPDLHKQYLDQANKRGE